MNFSYVLALPVQTKLNLQRGQKTKIEERYAFLFRKQPSAAPNKTFGQVSGLIS